MSSERDLKLVRDLIALTSSSSENEARNAAFKACELIRTRKIQVGDASTMSSADSSLLRSALAENRQLRTRIEHLSATNGDLNRSERDRQREMHRLNGTVSTLQAQAQRRERELAEARARADREAKAREEAEARAQFAARTVRALPAAPQYEIDHTGMDDLHELLDVRELEAMFPDPYRGARD